ncbi:relaxin-3 receptor 1 [Neoarius graeffei]|uniref:relaxin-3 receptor 1 n=1 Tax=Neoarius graeffei TaxID=443677 RepID=UPI00298C4659|nr:relaxin-3 receptor 1 [Neoarius graeffei]
MTSCASAKRALLVLCAGAMEVITNPEPAGDSFQSVTANSSVIFGTLEDIDVSADGSPVLRCLISVTYAAVCAAGLLGNLFVLVFIRARQARRKSGTNVFVLHLAVTDLQFALTLPFWAADAALDFSWPFGDVMCKLVLSVTVMNMYAGVFFLTAMSVTRYRCMASALQDGRGARVSAQLVAAVLWLLATAATAPTAVFSTVNEVAGEKLCLLRFPNGQSWLAVYHLQKILLAFVIPMAIVSISYLLLLRLVRRRSLKSRTRVIRSVAVVVLSFFLCWMPNHAVTLWGVLVKLNVVPWDKAYYVVHTYVFPLTVCLAHANSCLNPVIYCLMRSEFRRKLRDLFFRDGTRARSPCTPDA